jgi:ABC-type multidrug transport system fused ATPase/permease subunit
MLPEDQEEGEVDLKIFKEFIKLNGGYCDFAVMICLAMTLWISFTTASSIVMERWCENPIGEDYDLYIYIGLIVGSNIFIFFRAYKLIMAGTRQGKIVHKSMMKSLLYASLGDFFNRIPIGRIINRLSKDLRELDEVIGIKIGNMIVSFFLLMGTLTVCIYSSTLWILVPIVVVGYGTQQFRKYYMKSQIEVARF